jgi:hypothetical protein
MSSLNERKRGEAKGFLLGGADQISVPEGFHVSQSTLSRLRPRMLTTGSLNDHFRGDRPRVATRRQDHETPLLHLRNRFQATIKTAVHFRTHNNAQISPKNVRNRSKKAGLTARRPYKGLSLTRNRRDA